MIKKSCQSMSVYFSVLSIIRTKLITIFLLGFSSGLPFLLIVSTLNIWLTESHINKTQIGMFAWLTISYPCKFLFSPFVDRIKLPFLFKYLGQRKSWILFSQMALAISLSFLGYTEPSKNLLLTIIAVFMVGLFSAIQDIAIEAYRIEILDKQRLGVGVSVSILGYRTGMLFSGAGTIYIAAYFHSWTIAYNIMAGCMLIGIITTLAAIEPEVIFKQNNDTSSKQWFVNVIVQPLKSFFINPQWKIVVIFIFCYKFIGAVLNTMSMPFLLEMGFNKVEIAHVTKSFGIIAMICGSIYGGFFLKHNELWKLLVLATILQFLTGCLFVGQARIGHNILFLFITMGIENFTSGLAQVALITYFSTLCVRPYTAVHYSILSSFSSFVRINFSAIAGWLADKMVWQKFYLLVCLSSILSMIILKYNIKHFQFCRRPSAYEHM